MPGVPKQIFERHKTISATEANAEAETSFIWAAEHPRVSSCQGVSPQRLLSRIEKGKQRLTHHSGGTFFVTDGVDGLE
jgi:hypothetical protein